METVKLGCTKIKVEDCVSVPSIITAEDFEGMAGDLEHGSSTKAAETHALIVEGFGEALKTHVSSTLQHHKTKCTLFLLEMEKCIKIVC